MPKNEPITIRIVSHGPGCLDGVAAAAAVGRFYSSHRVIPIFSSNGESDRTIQRVRPMPGALNELWITDLSWTSTATAEHLAALMRAGTSVYWIDHHRTAVGRTDAPEFQVRLTGRVLSERFSAARLVYNFLKRRTRMLDETAARGFESFSALAKIADDHDRWIHKVPESSDWALAVQTLGSAGSYQEIMRMREPALKGKLRRALEAGRQAMEQSKALAHSTLVERRLGNGFQIITACCFGYSSEVAAGLYANQRQTVIALFDLRSQGVSLRRSADCEVDLSCIAHSFGGGGHAAAAGFSLEPLKRSPAEKLAEVLDKRLSDLPPPVRSS